MFTSLQLLSFQDESSDQRIGFNLYRIGREKDPNPTLNLIRKRGKKPKDKIQLLNFRGYAKEEL